MSVSNMLKIKHTAFDFEAPWSFAYGNDPSDVGYWLIWGKEKNGKTWKALLLAKYLATKKKVLYVSGEEGVGKEFTASCIRAGITDAKNISFYDFVPLSFIEKEISRRNGFKVVFVDNVTVYKEELKQKKLLELKEKYPDVLFVFLAHEERGEPYTSAAKLIRRLAKIIVYVEGLQATVSGRCVGGTYTIDEGKAKLCWGDGDAD